MKYISVDVETTGLNPEKNQLLEIGMVIEDTQKPNEHVDNLPKCRILIPHKEYQINTYCMNLHRSLFIELDLVDWDRLKKEGFYRDDNKNYYSLPDNVFSIIATWTNKHLGERKYVTAGKNFYGFDYNFLKPLLGSLKFHHRSLDPCTLFMQPEDKVPPDLAECCKRAGIDIQGYHTAVGDAKTVIHLLRRGKSDS